MPEVNLKQEEHLSQLYDIFVGGAAKALDENTLYFVAIISAALLLRILTNNKKRRRR